MDKVTLVNSLKTVLGYSANVQHQHADPVEDFIDLLEEYFDSPEVKFLYDRSVCSQGKAPFYATKGAAGADVFSAETYVLQPGEQKLFSTGLYLEVPTGFECQVRPRSGLAAKSKVTITNAPGTLDADYRGEMKVMLINHGADPVTIMTNDRIAQVVIARVARAKFVEVERLSQTQRGEGGFGSTGK